MDMPGRAFDDTWRPERTLEKLDFTSISTVPAGTNGLGLALPGTLSPAFPGRSEGVKKSNCN